MKIKLLSVSMLTALLAAASAQAEITKGVMRISGAEMA